jgi:hypothetical protein
VVPDTWSLAYDRSADEQLGTQAFFAELKKFTTLSIFKLAKPEGDFDPAALLAWVLDEPRKNVRMFRPAAAAGVCCVVRSRSHPLSGPPASPPPPTACHPPPPPTALTAQHVLVQPADGRHASPARGR